MLISHNVVTDTTMQNPTATATKGREPEETHNLDNPKSNSWPPLHVSSVVVLEAGLGPHSTAQKKTKCTEQKPESTGVITLPYVRGVTPCI